jgi:hypothetical protein
MLFMQINIIEIKYINYSTRFNFTNKIIISFIIRSKLGVPNSRFAWFTFYPLNSTGSYIIRLHYVNVDFLIIVT